MLQDLKVTLLYEKPVKLDVLLPKPWSRFTKWWLPVTTKIETITLTTSTVGNLWISGIPTSNVGMLSLRLCSIIFESNVLVVYVYQYEIIR